MMKEKNKPAGMGRDLKKTGMGYKPLRGKTLYLHLTKGLAAFESDLKLLGASIEKCLSREVNIVITDNIQYRKEKKDGASHTSPAVPSPFNFTKGTPDSPADSPGTTDGGKLVTRGMAIAQKARNARSYGSTNVIENAMQWNIKIIHIDQAREGINKHLEKIPESVRKAHQTNTNNEKAKNNSSKKAKVRHLKGNYIKFEAVSKHYRPVYDQLEALPCVNVTSVIGQCPFERPKPGVRGGRARLNKDPTKDEGDKAEIDNRGADIEDRQFEWQETGGTKTTEDTKVSKKKGKAVKEAPIKIMTAGDIARLKKEKQRQEQKRGYCELCEIKYDDLHKHLQTTQHKDFKRDNKNYESLDEMIRDGPSIQEFIQRVAQRHQAGTSSVAPDDDVALLSEVIMTSPQMRGARSSHRNAKTRQQKVTFSPVVNKQSAPKRNSIICESLVRRSPRASTHASTISSRGPGAMGGLDSPVKMSSVRCSPRKIQFSPLPKTRSPVKVDWDKVLKMSPRKFCDPRNSPRKSPRKLDSVSQKSPKKLDSVSQNSPRKLGPVLRNSPKKLDNVLRNSPRKLDKIPGNSPRKCEPAESKLVRDNDSVVTMSPRSKVKSAPSTYTVNVLTEDTRESNAAKYLKSPRLRSSSRTRKGENGEANLENLSQDSGVSRISRSRVSNNETEQSSACGVAKNSPFKKLTFSPAKCDASQSSIVKTQNSKTDIQTLNGDTKGETPGDNSQSSSCRKTRSSNVTCSNASQEKSDATPETPSDARVIRSARPSSVGKRNASPCVTDKRNASPSVTDKRNASPSVTDKRIASPCVTDKQNTSTGATQSSLSTSTPSGGRVTRRSLAPHCVTDPTQIHENDKRSASPSITEQPISCRLRKNSISSPCVTDKQVSERPVSVTRNTRSSVASPHVTESHTPCVTEPTNVERVTRSSLTSPMPVSETFVKSTNNTPITDTNTPTTEYVSSAGRITRSSGVYTPGNAKSSVYTPGNATGMWTDASGEISAKKHNNSDFALREISVNVFKQINESPRKTRNSEKNIKPSDNASQNTSNTPGKLKPSTTKTSMKSSPCRSVTKIRMDESVKLLSDRSMARMFSSDDEGEFEGFESIEDLVPSDASYEYVSEIDYHVQNENCQNSSGDKAQLVTPKKSKVVTPKKSQVTPKKTLQHIKITPNKLQNSAQKLRYIQERLNSIPASAEKDKVKQLKEQMQTIFQSVSKLKAKASHYEDPDTTRASTSKQPASPLRRSPRKRVLFEDEPDYIKQARGPQNILSLAFDRLLVDSSVEQLWSNSPPKPTRVSSPGKRTPVKSPKRLQHASRSELFTDKSCEKSNIKPGSKCADNPSIMISPSSSLNTTGPTSQKVALPFKSPAKHRSHSAESPRKTSKPTDEPARTSPRKQLLKTPVKNVQTPHVRSSPRNKPLLSSTPICPLNVQSTKRPLFDQQDVVISPSVEPLIKNLKIMVTPMMMQQNKAQKFIINKNSDSVSNDSSVYESSQSMEDNTSVIQDNSSVYKTPKTSNRNSDTKVCDTSVVDTSPCVKDGVSMYKTPKQVSFAASPENRSTGVMHVDNDIQFYFKSPAKRSETSHSEIDNTFSPVIENVAPQKTPKSNNKKANSNSLLSPNNRSDILSPNSSMSSSGPTPPHKRLLKSGSSNKKSFRLDYIGIPGPSKHKLRKSMSELNDKLNKMDVANQSIISKNVLSPKFESKTSKTKEVTFDKNDDKVQSGSSVRLSLIMQKHQSKACLSHHHGPGGDCRHGPGGDCKHVNKCTNPHSSGGRKSPRKKLFHRGRNVASFDAYEFDESSAPESVTKEQNVITISDKHTVCKSGKRSATPMQNSAKRLKNEIESPLSRKVKNTKSPLVRNFKGYESSRYRDEQKRPDSWSMSPCVGSPMQKLTPTPVIHKSIKHKLAKTCPVGRSTRHTRLKYTPTSSKARPSRVILSNKKRNKLCEPKDTDSQLDPEPKRVTRSRLLSNCSDTSSVRDFSVESNKSQKLKNRTDHERRNSSPKKQKSERKEGHSSKKQKTSDNDINTFSKKNKSSDNDANSSKRHRRSESPVTKVSGRVTRARNVTQDCEITHDSPGSKRDNSRELTFYEQLVRAQIKHDKAKSLRTRKVDTDSESFVSDSGSLM